MLEGFREFWKNPYRDGMDAYDWALFVGFVICLIVGWKLVLGHIMAEID